MQRRTNNTALLLISFVIIYSIMPIVSRLTSRYATTYSYMLIVLLLYLMTMAQSLNTYVSILLPMIFYEALTFFINKDTLVMWGYRVLTFLLPIILGYYLLYENPARNRTNAKLLILCLVVTAITTIIGIRQYPSAARYLATVASPDEPLAVLYNMRNIGGYDFVYTLVLLYPLLICAYKKRRINLLTAIVGSAGILALTIISEYTTALLLWMVTSVLFFMKRDLRKKDVIVLLIVSVIVLVLFYTVFSGLLLSLSEVIKSKDISERLISLAGGRTGLENAEDNRIWLYRASINTFFSNPILGTFLSGGRGTGGHSAILDMVAQYGLLGIFLLFHMYKRIYRYFFEPFRDDEGFGYYYWLLLQAILLSTVNTGFWFQILAFYAPLLFLRIQEKEGVSIEGNL